MLSRDDLHGLVDEIPESMLSLAGRVLKALKEIETAIIGLQPGETHEVAIRRHQQRTGRRADSYVFVVMLDPKTGAHIPGPEEISLPPLGRGDEPQT